MLRVDFVTLFPGIVQAALSDSIMARAVEKAAVRFSIANPRDFCYDAHQKVDDTPYGGEAGMLIRAEPVALALESLDARKGSAAIVLTAPTGSLFDQSAARELAGFQHIALLCGHYEGFDHRVESSLATHVFSIGDYVLTNGELPALVIADAVVRLLPGVLGSERSIEADSFADGMLSAPNYTRPENWRGLEVPAVLRSGDHAAIRRWRREQSLRLTLRRRPELLARARLEKSDLDMLSS
jgi:tRNA (guanine37-N1)-methyltransferase